jgi:hypothetical protein
MNANRQQVFGVLKLPDCNRLFSDKRAPHLFSVKRAPNCQQLLAIKERQMVSNHLAMLVTSC